jgi:hypothetical protein
MRKADKIMEIPTNRTSFEGGDRVRIKLTGKTGIINAADGGVVYVLIDDTNESRIFEASIDEDASIELITSAPTESPKGK